MLPLPFDIEKFASEIVAKTKLKSEKGYGTCLVAPPRGRVDERRLRKKAKQETI